MTFLRESDLTYFYALNDEEVFGIIKFDLPSPSIFVAAYFCLNDPPRLEAICQILVSHFREVNPASAAAHLAEDCVLL